MLKKILCIPFIICLFLFSTAYPQTIKIIYEEFDTPFNTGGEWESINKQNVKDGIKNILEDEFSAWSLTVTDDPNETTFDILLTIGDTNFGQFGNAPTGAFFTTERDNDPNVFSTEFSLREAWQDTNALEGRIICAIGNSAVHEVGHVFNLAHAFMFESFDPSVIGVHIEYTTWKPRPSSTWNGDPLDPLDANSVTEFHFMANGEPFITLEQRAINNREFSTNNSKPMLNLNLNKGADITVNSLIWHMKFEDGILELDNDIDIATGKKFRISAQQLVPRYLMEIDTKFKTITETGTGELLLNGISAEILSDFAVTIPGENYILDTEPQNFSANPVGGVAPHTFTWEIREVGEPSWQTIDDTDNTIVLEWDDMDTYGIEAADGIEIELRSTITTSPQIWESTGPTDSFVLTPIELQAVSKRASDRLPKTFALDQNYPNPFNPETTISFQVPKASPVRITIYNTAGQELVTLIDRNMNAGFYSVHWNAKNAASGIYLYTIKAGDFTSTRRMVVLK